MSLGEVEKASRESITHLVLEAEAIISEEHRVRDGIFIHFSFFPGLGSVFFELRRSMCFVAKGGFEKIAPIIVSSAKACKTVKTH